MAHFRLDTSRDTGEVMLLIETKCGFRPVMGWPDADSLQDFAENLIGICARISEDNEGVREISEKLLQQALGDDPETLVVAASDYSKALPHSIRAWTPGTFVGLGCDGFGRSEGRASLRDYFEVDARHVSWAALEALAREGRFAEGRLAEAASALEIDPDKPDPTRA